MQNRPKPIQFGLSLLLVFSLLRDGFSAAPARPTSQPSAEFNTQALTPALREFIPALLVRTGIAQRKAEVITAKFIGSGNHSKADLNKRTKLWKEKNKLSPISLGTRRKWARDLEASLGPRSRSPGTLYGLATNLLLDIADCLKQELVRRHGKAFIMSVGEKEYKYLAQGNPFKKTKPLRVFSEIDVDDNLTIYVAAGALKDKDIPFRIAHELAEHMLNRDHWLASIYEFVAFKPVEFLGMHVPPRLAWELQHAMDTEDILHLQMLQRPYRSSRMQGNDRHNAHRDAALRYSLIVSQAAERALKVLEDMEPQEEPRTLTEAEKVHEDLGLLIRAVDNLRPALSEDDQLGRELRAGIESPERISARLGWSLEKVQMYEALLLQELRADNEIPRHMSISEWVVRPSSIEEVNLLVASLPRLPPVLVEDETLPSEYEQLVSFMERAGRYFYWDEMPFQVAILIRAMRDGVTDLDALSKKTKFSLAHIASLAAEVVQHIRSDYRILENFALFKPLYEPGEPIDLLPIPRVIFFRLAYLNLKTIDQVRRNTPDYFRQNGFTTSMLRDLQVGLALCGYELAGSSKGFNPPPAAPLSALVILSLGSETEFHLSKVLFVVSVVALYSIWQRFNSQKSPDLAFKRSA